VSVPSAPAARLDRPAPREGIETAFLAPEVVLLDSTDGRVHHLNPGASAVWMLIDGEQDADGIAEELADLFDRPLRDMVGEVDAAVEDFAARGLLAGSRAAVPVTRTGAVIARPPDP
jgi:Coenzyme PQQ synthesis protein D (PqqD)